MLMVIIQQMPTAMFVECLTKRLPNRWRRCVAAKGEYFEGDDIPVPPDSELLDSSSDSD